MNDKTQDFAPQFLTIIHRSDIEDNLIFFYTILAKHQNYNQLDAIINEIEKRLNAHENLQITNDNSTLRDNIKTVFLNYKNRNMENTQEREIVLGGIKQILHELKDSDLYYL